MRKPLRNRHWADDLSPMEKEIVGRWSSEVGPERLARIASIITQKARGPSGKPDSVALLEMARRKIDKPNEGNHSIAKSVAEDPRFSSGFEAEHYADRLNMLFNEQEYRWLYLVNKLPEELQEPPGNRGRADPSEARALARIIELMPNQANIYSTVKHDAKRLGADHLKRAEKLDRKVCERVVLARLDDLHRMVRGVKCRTFYDLVFHHPDGPPEGA